MLTTAGESVDRIVGLELGADDYVPKPFDLRELLARVRAVHRRVQAVTWRHATPPRQRRQRERRPAARAFGHCELDLDQRKLFGEDGSRDRHHRGRVRPAGAVRRHPNRPLNRDQIMQQAHNRGWDVFDRSIDLRVMRLRRKIERNPDKPEVIKTVRNVGYVFVARG
jgi:DNA-binding response OmpR family regulator